MNGIGGMKYTLLYRYLTYIQFIPVHTWYIPYIHTYIHSYIHTYILHTLHTYVHEGRDEAMASTCRGVILETKK